MSGGGGTTSSSTSQPQNPAIEQLISGTVPYLQQAQQNLPLVNFTNPQVRSVAGMSPTQQWVSGTIPSIAQESPYTQQAAQQIAQLTGGPIGSSPLTQQGMQAFQDITRPGIENTLATMGLGRSGAGAEILARAQTAAAVPLLSQEIQNREAAVGQLAGMGGQETQRLGQAATLGMAQGGTERNIGQAALDAIYEDFLRRQQLGQSLFLPGSGFPLQPLSTVTRTTQENGGFFGK